MLFVTVLFYLYAMHALCDYPLQGSFMAEEKGRFGSPYRLWALTGHAAIHGAAVAIVLENYLFGMAEAAAHLVIDELKVREQISLHVDQSLHLLCKVVWALGYCLTVQSTL